MRVRLDIVSDVVCPWCFVGKRRLERALDRRPLWRERLVIRWRPFQLAPDMPEEGLDPQEYYARKFPDPERRKALFAMLVREGGQVGIDFAFEKITRLPNTLDAHRLIRWAGSAGCQDRVVEALFRAHFLEGRFIGDQAVLTAIAREAGMDAELVAELLAGGRDCDLIRQDIRAAQAMGITGVPSFLFAGSFLLQGAQEESVFLALFDRLDQALAPSA
ncbi:MAG: DsbA family oxidoreductase [Alphaproteobacteria bacterium]|nr:MAG: DsbA family oxidoreductase [Alphaproteobacteria bacterium]